MANQAAKLVFSVGYSDFGAVQQKPMIIITTITMSPAIPCRVILRSYPNFTESG
jgi:hypothetical protein